MELENLDRSRKRIVAFLCIAVFIPVVAAFVIIDWIEGDKIESYLDMILLVVVIAALLCLKLWDKDVILYYAALILFSIAFLYLVGIGSGEGTALYWLPSFPLLFMFFLGKKKGIVFSFIFFLLLCIVLINPFSFEIYSYGLKKSLRFLGSFLVVTLISFGLESSREIYGQLLQKENTKLRKEKQKLEKAAREIKTLSGLIPICCNCKKIRNDEGFWQQVEAYVHEHSDARFSHGICPDCFKKLYPEIETEY